MKYYSAVSQELKRALALTHRIFIGPPLQVILAFYYFTTSVITCTVTFYLIQTTYAITCNFLLTSNLFNYMQLLTYTQPLQSPVTFYFYTTSVVSCNFYLPIFTTYEITCTVALYLFTYTIITCNFLLCNYFYLLIYTKPL